MTTTTEIGARDITRLKKAIKATKHARSSNVTQPPLLHTNIIATPDCLTVQACDAFRVSRYVGEPIQDFACNIVVDNSFDDAAKQIAGSCGVTIDRNCICFESLYGTTRIRLHEPTYPDLNRLLDPSHIEASATLDAEALMVLLLSFDKNATSTIIVFADGYCVTANGEPTDGGSVGNAVVSLNPKFLRQAVKALTGEIAISVSGNSFFLKSGDLTEMIMVKTGRKE